MVTEQKNTHTWKTLAELQEPFNDAVNYKTRQEKEFFARIFLRTDDLQSCLRPSVYYLIGEKGAGKTAYAAYLENNATGDNRCRLTTMTETQYKRFIIMKTLGQLEYSDYVSIWRPMLLNMMAQVIVLDSKRIIDAATGKFAELEREINSFNKKALNPEVEVAFEMVNESKDGMSFGNDKAGRIDFNESSRKTEKTGGLRHHLLDRETSLKEALSELKLSKNHILFIDGVDYRPEEIPYMDYLACIKGIGEAVWQLNTEFFGNIRDSKGRMKVVLLVRPDVFSAMNLYNSNSRLRDNSVLLVWTTTEHSFRTSQLYRAVDKYFSRQQTTDIQPMNAVDHYLHAEKNNAIFRRLLRTTFQKPRDILTFVRIARTVSINSLSRGSATRFESDIVFNAEFTREYSEYLLGEVRDYANFYMTQEDFSRYMKFFQYLNGRAEFMFTEFLEAYVKFKDWIAREVVQTKNFLRDGEALLQFFFDVNLIGYRENVVDDSNRQQNFVHFSYRERTLTNIAPKVKTTAMLVVNPGIAKALDIGLRANN